MADMTDKQKVAFRKDMQLILQTLFQAEQLIPQDYNETLGDVELIRRLINKVRDDIDPLPF